MAEKNEKNGQSGNPDGLDLISAFEMYQIRRSQYWFSRNTYASFKRAIEASQTITQLREAFLARASFSGLMDIKKAYRYLDDVFEILKI